MSDSLKKKVEAFVQTWDQHYGKPERPAVTPQPSSADAAAVTAVAAKNAQVVAAAALGLHGPPVEGIEAARRLMQHFVDWNEVRVARPQTLVGVLGKQPRATERVALLHRFLETFFLKRRKLDLDFLLKPETKPPELRRFLTELQVFDREELAAVLLDAFRQRFFPPADPLRDVAEQTGLVPRKTTTLQMAKRFELGLDEGLLYCLYSHLYALANDSDREKLLAAYKKKK
ncbi:MAG: hypothetical protein ABSE73_01685 [Planctomycetota bacterium]